MPDSKVEQRAPADLADARPPIRALAAKSQNSLNEQQVCVGGDLSHPYDLPAVGTDAWAGNPCYGYIGWKPMLRESPCHAFGNKTGGIPFFP